MIKLAAALMAFTAAAPALGTPADPANPYAAPAPVTIEAGHQPAAARSAAVWGLLSYFGGGHGLGGRVTLPVGRGLLSHAAIEDSFALDLGVDYLRYSFGGALGGDLSWNLLRPVGGLLWNLHLSEDLALYPKLELGYDLVWLAGGGDTYAGLGGLHLAALVGMLYDVGPLSLRAELGWGHLKGGVAFRF